MSAESYLKQIIIFRNLVDSFSLGIFPEQLTSLS